MRICGDVAREEDHCRKEEEECLSSVRDFESEMCCGG